MDIKGKGAVVTGAGSGIGRGIALALADAGASGVIVADVNLASAQAVCMELQAKGVRAGAFQCDVRSAEAVDALADYAWDQLGHVEILCNNAGVIATGAGFDAQLHNVLWQFEVNVFGVYNGCRSFGQRFLKGSEKAWICNTASHHAMGTPSKNVAHYVASKHAVLGYSDAFRLEYGDRIGFSVLCPGIVNTNLWDAGSTRPKEHGDAFGGSPQNQDALKSYGMDAEYVGGLVTKAIANEDFYVFTHPFTIELIEKRYQEAKGCIERQWPDGPLPIHKRTPTQAATDRLKKAEV